MGSGEPRRFPLAAQPEIMRAAEKDDQYASFVYDACRDAFRHLFGTFSSLSLSTSILQFKFLISPSSCRYKSRRLLSERGLVPSCSRNWNKQQQSYVLILFCTDKTSWSDALLCVNNWCRAANPWRRILWHYSGFFFF